MEKIALTSDSLACPKMGFVLKKLLGEGAYGKVFLACAQEDCSKVVKIQILKDGTAVADFREEAKISQRASEKGYGPRLFGACITDGKDLDNLLTNQSETTLELAQWPKIGILVQEKWDGSLDKLKPGWCTPELYRKFAKVVDKMHDDGIIHGDLLPKNVLYKLGKDKQVKDVIPTDFGLSFFAKKPAFYTKNQREWIQSLHEYLWDPVQPVYSAIESSDLGYVMGQDVLRDPTLLDAPMLLWMELYCQ